MLGEPSFRIWRIECSWWGWRGCRCEVLRWPEYSDIRLTVMAGPLTVYVYR